MFSTSCLTISCVRSIAVTGGRFNRLDVEGRVLIAQPLEFSLFAYIFLNQLLLIYTSLNYNLLETPLVPIEADTEAKTERWQEPSVGLSLAKRGEPSAEASDFCLGKYS